MPTPVVHLLAGPNGAGKSTYYHLVLGPSTGLPLINADRIAQERWPEDPLGHSYEAASVAAEQREEAIRDRRSFATETVFSHPSKLELLRAAGDAGFRRYLYVIMVPEELAVRRVGVRVEGGGHTVPEEKIRARFKRLWSLLGRAIQIVEEAEVLDNTRAATPFERVAHYANGRLIGPADWPPWTPLELQEPGS
jgi:predicted ABC-type ATPase